MSKENGLVRDKFLKSSGVPRPIPRNLAREGERSRTKGRGSLPSRKQCVFIPLALARGFLRGIKKIRLVVFDFDGVFTDNRVIVNEKGEEAVICNRSDGIGLSRLKGLGIDLLILSNEPNRVVKERAKKLNLECINNCADKPKRLAAEVKKRGLSLTQVAYVGNDINDIECLKMVGLPMVVSGAHSELLPYAKYKTKAGGGNGAVREICDLIFIRLSQTTKAQNNNRERKKHFYAL